MATIASTSFESAVWTSTRCHENSWNERHREGVPVMRAEVHWVPGPWPGRMGIVPRPRGGDWLEDEVRSWRASGLDVVASLLTPEEAAELELQEEEAQSRKEGLEFYALPIPDRGVPPSRADLIKLVDRLERALESGKNVAL